MLSINIHKKKILAGTKTKVTISFVYIFREIGNEVNEFVLFLGSLIVVFILYLKDINLVNV